MNLAYAFRSSQPSWRFARLPLEKCIEEGVEIEAVRFRRSNMTLQISGLANPLADRAL